MHGTVPVPDDPLEEFGPVSHHQFGGRRRRGSPHVGDEVGNRKIDLVPHGRDDGNARRRDRPDDDLLVERPEVLERSAAAPYDQDVEAAHLVKLLDGAGDLAGRALTLHRDWIEHDGDAGIALMGDLHDVPDRRARGRGDHPDPAREKRQRSLARRVEQAFSRQPRFELLEGKLERSDPFRLGILHDHLIVALGLVDRHPASADELQPVLKGEPQGASDGPEQDRTNLTGGVFQREVGVSGGRDAEVGDLPLHPDVREGGLDVDSK